MNRHDLNGDRISLSTLASQLAQALGEEKARELILATATDMAFTGPELSREQALEVLDRLANTPGLVGVCARFARTRVILSSIQLETS